MHPAALAAMEDSEAGSRGEVVMLSALSSRLCALDEISLKFTRVDGEV
jgi:hypothetical protein